MLLWILALAGAIGMLLPVYGPTVDKGYAEKLPTHSHVILKGGSIAAHRTAPASSDGVLAVPGPDQGGAFAIVVAVAAAAFAVAAGVPLSGGPMRRIPMGAFLVPMGWRDKVASPPPRTLIAD